MVGGMGQILGETRIGVWMALLAGGNDILMAQPRAWVSYL